jgi:hypothetical protein
MAGGYHLLVPAGMAVMIAYLIQIRLSSFLRYRSLYEGQVPTRRDSPAHYMEHIQTALSLLGKRGLPLMDKVGHLDLLRLVRSRMRFDLPGGKELTMGMVREDSPLIATTIADLYARLQQYDFEIIAVLRREHVLLPHPNTLLEANDRLMLIDSPQVREPLRQFIAPLPQAQEGGMQSPVPA